MVKMASIQHKIYQGHTILGFVRVGWLNMMYSQHIKVMFTLIYRACEKTKKSIGIPAH